METVSNAIKRLMISEPFYGIFASGLQKCFSSQVEKMAIVPDGLNYKLLINKDYWYSLDKVHRIGLLKHNLLHMCFFHVTNYQDYLGRAKGKNLLQVAFDLEVNSYLDEEEWPDDTSVQLFRKYPNLPKRQGTLEYVKILNGLIDGDDSELIWGNDTEGAIELLENTPPDHDTWNNGRGVNINVVRAQLELRMRTVTDAVNRRIPQELRNIIAELFTFKKPIFQWKKFFRNFLANAIDYLPKNTRRKESNRFSGAMGHTLAKKHTILVGVDTSGSIGQSELDEFFSEIYHVWKAGANVDIVEFDMEIQREYHYKGKTPREVKGRGGTDFGPFVDYFNSNERKYSLGICFTDGYASLYNINPVGKFCWVITSDGAQEQDYPGYKICIPKKVE